VPIKNLTRGDRFGAQVSPLAEEKKIFFFRFDVGVKKKFFSAWGKKYHHVAIFNRVTKDTLLRASEKK